LHVLCTWEANKVFFNVTKKENCTKGILDNIYSEVWGPVLTKSHDDARYYITFMDDYS